MQGIAWLDSVIQPLNNWSLGVSRGLIHCNFMQTLGLSNFIREFGGGLI